MTKKNCEPENIMELTKEFCEICNFDPDSIQEEFGFINVLRAVVEWYKREEHKSEIKCVADMCSIFAETARVFHNRCDHYTKVSNEAKKVTQILRDPDGNG